MFLECDRAGCPSRQNVDSAMNSDEWVVFHLWRDCEGDPQHFCSVTCMVMTVSKFEVPEGIGND